MIVYGYGFYGRNNVRYVRDACSQCGAAGWLRSYNARVFGTLYWIPLIPWTGYRIRQECSSCEMGQQIKQGDWRKLKREAIDPPLAAFAQTPHDPEVAGDAIGATALTDDPMVFLPVALEVQKLHADNPELMSSLASGYAYFGLEEESVEAFKLALAAGGGDGVRAALANELIQQRRPGEAAAYVEALPETADFVGSRAMLAIAHQSLGEHAQALAVLDGISAELAEETELTQALEGLRERSRQHEGSGRRLEHPELAPRVPPPSSSTPLWWVPYCWIPLIIGLIFSGVVAANAGGGGKVYLANGLSEAYEVQVNGERYSVPGRGVREIKVEHGVLRVEPVDGGLPFEAYDVAYEEPFFERSGSKLVIVINPDRAALLREARVKYSAQARGAGENQYQVRVGEASYRLPEVDYCFHAAPNQIQMSKRQGIATRIELTQLKSEGVEAVSGLMASETDPKLVARYIEQTLRYEPQRLELLNQLATVAGPAAALEVVKGRLNERPLRIGWHRIYQDLVAQVDPGQDLYGEYAERAEAEPGSSGLAYLAARASTELEDALRWERAALAAEPVSPFAYLTLAHRCMGLGEFKTALQAIDKALALRPGWQEMTMRLIAACEGAGDHARAASLIEGELARVGDGQLSYPLRFGHTVSLVRVLARARRREAADAAIRDLVKTFKQAGATPAVLAEVRTLLTMHLHVGAGQQASYCRLAAQLENPELQLQLALIKGDLADAARRAAAMPETPATLHAMLYALAAHRGDAALAERSREQLLAAWRQGTPDDRRMAAAFASEEGVSPAAVAQLLRTDRPGSGAIMMAFATRFPKRSEAFREVAGRLCDGTINGWVFAKALVAKPQPAPKPAPPQPAPPKPAPQPR